MKFLTPQEVNDRIEAYNQLLGREKTLQEELLSLKIYGTREHTDAALQRHDEIIKQIETLRREAMLPIIRECCEFISNWEQYKKDRGIESEENG